MDQQGILVTVSLTPKAFNTRWMVSSRGRVFGRRALYRASRLMPLADWYALTATVIAFIGLFRFKRGMIPVIFGSTLAGFAWKIFIP